MSTWFIETGVYVLAMLAALGIGLALLYWGLFGDRSKGRRRCPKCWYDLRGVSGALTCPECGHEARRERHLYRNRRRWPAIIVGTMLVLPSAYLLTVYAGWQREQWALQSLRDANTKRSVYPTPMHIWPEPISYLLPEWIVQFGYRVDGLSVNVFDERDLDSIEQLYFLKSLGLFEWVDDDALARISRMRSLRELWVEAGYSKGSIAQLKVLPKLRSLSLQLNSGGQLENMDQIATLMNLAIYDAGYGDLGDQDLASIARCQQLEALTVSIGNSVTFAGVAGLCNLKELRNLDVSAHPESGVTLFNISCLIRLETLTVYSFKLDAHSFEQIAELPHLRRLELNDVPLTDSLARSLAACANIQDLSIDSGPELTDTGLAALASMPNLREITVFGLGTSRTGLNEFQKRRPDVNVNAP